MEPAMSAASPCASGALPCPSALVAPLLGAALAVTLIVAATVALPLLAPVENTHFAPERLAEVQAMLGR